MNLPFEVAVMRILHDWLRNNITASEAMERLVGEARERKLFNKDNLP